MRSEQYSALMAYRVRRVLLVASRYDAFLLEEEGQLGELVAREYRELELNLRDAPRFATATNAAEALEMACREPLDMVVATTHLPDMSLAEFGARLKQVSPDVPLGVLAPHAWDIPRLQGLRESGAVDCVYLWSGDAKTLLALFGQEEDRRNAERDILTGGVRAIILVEDDVRFLSFLLPALYTEVTKQTSRLMAEGLNLSHRLERLQARPKVLLARSFEEALALWQRFKDNVLAVIADVGFPRHGSLDPEAGLDLAHLVRSEDPSMPVLLQSAEPGNEAAAAALGVWFADKSSIGLLDELRRFMLEACGFGGFVFRVPDGGEVGKAENLRELLTKLDEVPVASLEHHASRNGFSRWFAARTEFDLAALIRPRKVSEFASLEELRRYLRDAVRGYLRELQRHLMPDFARERFDPTATFARIGAGPLGGKGRGLAFVQRLLAEEQTEVADVEVAIPPGVVLATDIFEAFMEGNGLDTLPARAATMSDAEILDAFRGGRFARPLRAELGGLLQLLRDPIAVRSSSLLEDSPYQPFAGVYATIMLPNNHPSLDVRLAQLLEAIKVVYASTFMRAARDYLEATPYRIEEERMGVVIQRLVGRPRGGHFYPLISGVASSHNYYPFAHQTPEEGVALIAVGLGKTVVEGAEALRFCPEHPQVLPQLSSVKDTLRNAQRRFWAVDMSRIDVIPGLDLDATLVKLEVAEALTRDDAALVASTYLRSNDVISDGLVPGGVPLVTFARLLKGKGMPLPAVLARVLAMARKGMGMPVEIEFAAEPGGADADPVFYVLQARPMVVEPAIADARLEAHEAREVIVDSAGALGHGCSEPLFDVVVVAPDLERARTGDAAVALERLNAELRREGRPYLLIGPGRWGSQDPWLGIPVSWSQISGVRAIVEADFADLEVERSQGSHFFHNLTSFGIPFLPVHDRQGGGRVDWAWLDRCAPQASAVGGKIRHLRLTIPLRAILDGTRRKGIVVLSPS